MDRAHLQGLAGRFSRRLHAYGKAHNIPVIPPVGVQLMLNGHEWVDRQACKHAISVEKEGNCFVGGSFQALDQLAETLREPDGRGRLTEVCDRWI